MTEEIPLTIVRPEDLSALPADIVGVEAHDLRDADLDVLAACRGLARLDLSHSPAITDDGLSRLAASPSLVFLFLGGCPAITDVGIASVCGIPTLESLMPCGCQQLGDGALEALPRAPRLREVFISGQGFTDEGMAHVARCEALEILGMDGPIGDRGYARIRSLPRLKTLQLPACHRITPKALVSFAALPALEELHFYGTPHIDDGWVDALAGLRRLTSLGLMGCGLTGDGLDRLRSALPAAEVLAG